MKPIILCYPKCGTCQKAEKWLKANGIDYIYRPIKEQKPTKEELVEWLSISNIPINKFFNTSGALYKDQKMKDKIKILTDDELVEILASDGLMVKRPIAVIGNKILIGFKEEDWVSTFIK